MAADIIVTVDLILREGGSDWQIKRFRELFGKESTLISKELCLKNANIMVYDWDWLKYYSFSYQYQWDFYNEAKAKANAEYKKATFYSFELYGEAIYNRLSEEKCNDLWSNYIAINKIAYPIYCRLKAIAFADAALGDYK